MGAHITKGESTIDPILSSIGIDYTKFFLLDASMAMIISIVALVVIRPMYLHGGEDGANKSAGCQT